MAKAKAFAMAKSNRLPKSSSSWPGSNTILHLAWKSRNHYKANRARLHSARLFCSLRTQGALPAAWSRSNMIQRCLCTTLVQPGRFDPPSSRPRCSCQSKGLWTAWKKPPCISIQKHKECLCFKCFPAVACQSFEYLAKRTSAFLLRW